MGSRARDGALDRHPSSLALPAHRGARHGLRPRRGAGALAARAGFNVSRFSYSDQQLKAFGLASKEITFHVQGSYAQFRNLLNLLEVSEYFIVLKRVSLGGADGANLSIDLRLATFFSEPDVSGPIPAAVATR